MTERQSARMSKIQNGGLDQYGAEPFKQQQFGPAGIEGVKCRMQDVKVKLFWSYCLGLYDVALWDVYKVSLILKFQSCYNICL